MKIETRIGIEVDIQFWIGIWMAIGNVIGVETRTVKELLLILLFLI